MNKARLIKILNLADRGSGEEADTARKILEDKLEEQGLSIDDLRDDQERFWINFGCRNRYERKLIIQIAAYLNQDKMDQIGSHIGKKSIDLFLTKSEEIGIRTAFSVLKPALKQSMDDAFLAFIIRNNLLIEPREDQEEMKEEDIERFVRASMMSRGIDRTHIRKQIGEGIA